MCALPLYNGCGSTHVRAHRIGIGEMGRENAKRHHSMGHLGAKMCCLSPSFRIPPLTLKNEHLSSQRWKLACEHTNDLVNDSLAILLFRLFSR